MQLLILQFFLIPITVLMTIVCYSSNRIILKKSYVSPQDEKIYSYNERNNKNSFQIIFEHDGSIKNIAFSDYEGHYGSVVYENSHIHMFAIVDEQSNYSVCTNFPDNLEKVPFQRIEKINDTYGCFTIASNGIGFIISEAVSPVLDVGLGVH
ncbi:MAG: hypothetical protein IJ191_07500 [Treponema sp.]|nr:hypothetical protein [Treponema sp.]